MPSWLQRRPNERESEFYATFSKSSQWTKLATEGEKTYPLSMTRAATSSVLSKILVSSYGSSIALNGITGSGKLVGQAVVRRGEEKIGAYLPW